MSNIGPAVHSNYVSFLSDIGGDSPASPASGSASSQPSAEFQQILADAATDHGAVPKDQAGPLGFFSMLSGKAPSASAVSGGPEAPVASKSHAETAPRTLQLQLNTTPGPQYGRPIAPEGSSQSGEWTILTDGSFFSVKDVTANGVAVLQPPPEGWGDTPASETPGSTSGDTPAAPASTPRTIQVAFDTTPGALYGRPIAPEGASLTGQWAVLADGSYFSASDVNDSGVATLHAPPEGWRSMPTGETLSGTYRLTPSPKTVA
jgi:hypothetical protein